MQVQNSSWRKHVRGPLFGGAVLLGCFGVVLVQVVSDGPLVSLDHLVNDSLAGLRNSTLAPVFVWISGVSNLITATSVCLAASAVAWVFNRCGFVLPIWVTYGGVLASVQGVKDAIGRVRPEPIEGIVATSASFPSGNSAIAAAVYGLLAVLIARQLPNQTHRSAIWTAALVLIALVGFSRLYLGVHYLSDVLAGFALGAFWALVGANLAGGRQAR